MRKAPPPKKPIQHSQPNVPFDPATFLAHYRPRRRAAAKYWPQTQPFVTELVLRLNPSSVKPTRRGAWALAGIAAYACSAGVPLEVDRVLHPSFVQRYIDVGWDGNREEGTLRTVRDLLSTLGRQLTVQAPWQPKARPIRRTPLRPPYSPDELHRLRAAIATQKLADRVRLEILVEAGLGWGIDGRWFFRIRPGDVRIDSRGAHLTARFPDRIITCRFEEETLLLEAIAANQVERLGTPLPSTRLLNAFLFRVNKRLAPLHLHLGRLRSTWLLAHLRASTPMRTLLYAAGLASPGHLGGLINSIELPDDVGRARELRGR